MMLDEFSTKAQLFINATARLFSSVAALLERGKKRETVPSLRRTLMGQPAVGVWNVHEDVCTRERPW